jgi:hypothetical protein
MISSGVRPSSPLQRIAVIALVEGLEPCGPSVTRKAQFLSGETFRIALDGVGAFLIFADVFQVEELPVAWPLLAERQAA